MVPYGFGGFQPESMPPSTVILTWPSVQLAESVIDGHPLVFPLLSQVGQGAVEQSRPFAICAAVIRPKVLPHPPWAA